MEIIDRGKNRMVVEVLEEHGYDNALMGLSLSYNSGIIRMPALATSLCKKDGGHNKFLESIVVWLDIVAPRYWWQQFDTYRVGITKQSESTMHFGTKRFLEQKDFVEDIEDDILDSINRLISRNEQEKFKRNLPEGFLQRRVVCVNYKTLRNILSQRLGHKMFEWKIFSYDLQTQLKHVELLGI